MKRFCLGTLLSILSIAATAQVKAGLSYACSLPRYEMQNNIAPAHSLNLFVTSQFKNFRKLSWGVEAGIGQYAFFSKKQDIRFPDGTGFSADVSYSSNIATVGMLSRFSFFKEAKVNPFLSGKLGYASFFTKVVVPDPDNADDCKPLDKNTPIQDHSFYVAYGAGLQIDISSKKKENHTWLDISVNQMHGTRLDYVNVKDIKAHIHNDPTGAMPTSEKVTPLSIRFVNVTTQTVHEHQLAEIYNSPLRFLEFKIGVVWNLTGNCNCK